MRSPHPAPGAPRRRVPRPVVPALAALTALTALAALATAPAASPTASAAAPPAAAAAAGPQQVERVLAISVDSLNPRALRRLGREGAPQIWRLIDRGAHTFRARSALEQTDTLPNHTTMVTGRAITPAHDGHGVTWNDERQDPATVEEAAGHPVSSVFAEVARAGRSAALFTTKEKLRLFERSWPGSLDRVTVSERRDAALVRAARLDLVEHHRDLTFVHLGAADLVGHRYGGMSPEYLSVVQRLDGLVGRLLKAVRRQPQLRGTVVVLTSDHGTRGFSHRDPAILANYRVPFVVWGRGVGSGDLYALQGPTYADPGRARVDYEAARQPVRSGDLANLTLDLLGLGPVPGSRFNVDQELRVG